MSDDLYPTFAPGREVLAKIMADRNTEKLAEPLLQSGTEPKYGTLVPPLVDSGDASLEAVAGGPDLDLTVPVIAPKSRSCIETDACKYFMRYRFILKSGKA